MHESTINEARNAQDLNSNRKFAVTALLAPNSSTCSDPLAAGGCQFAVNHFESGIASLSHLKHLAVDYVKIDGVLIKDLTDGPINRSMVKPISEIAHVMGCQTIAGFVESESTVDALRELRIDFAQGFWIDGPRPVW